MSVPTDETTVCNYNYPKDTARSIPITIKDYKSLEDGTYLNDIIVDFYLLFLKNNLRDQSENVHIFSSMFFKKLREPRRVVSDVNAFENDPSLSAAEKRFIRVQRWTKSVNLFEKKLLVFPCCENQHWFAILVFMPGFIKVSIAKISLILDKI